MVGIVTGSGLGLDNSSLQALGAKGLLGNPSEGKAGESVYVNATNGNPVIRDQDEMLLGQGLGAQIFRSYNSQDGKWREAATPTVTGLADRRAGTGRLRRCSRRTRRKASTR
jgi:hypothetical protein